MGKAVDLTGQKFERLTAIEPTEKRDVNGCVIWFCLCECGTEDVPVSSKHLRSGHTKSCGCLILDVKTTHGMCYSREYASRHAMIDRCENPNNPSFPNYGGRGIKVCDRWRNSFENFLEDMGLRPEGKTLDRWPDNDGDYELSNCKWSTPLEQQQNRRPVSCGSAKQEWFFAFNFETGEWFEGNSQRMFAEEHELNSRRISDCLHKKQEIHRGWTFEFLT